MSKHKKKEARFTHRASFALGLVAESETGLSALPVRRSLLGEGLGAFQPVLALGDRFLQGPVELSQVVQE